MENEKRRIVFICTFMMMAAPSLSACGSTPSSMDVQLIPSLRAAAGPSSSVKIPVSANPPSAIVSPIPAITPKPTKTPGKSTVKLADPKKYKGVKDKEEIYQVTEKALHAWVNHDKPAMAGLWADAKHDPSTTIDSFWKYVQDDMRYNEYHFTDVEINSEGVGMKGWDYATAKLFDGKAFVDFFGLVKIDGKWKIEYFD